MTPAEDPLDPAIRSELAALRVQAQELCSWGAEGPARALERAADRIEAILDAAEGELLPLARAAEESGYNRDSLRRMARKGRLKSERRGRELFFRREDLPRKTPERTAEVDGPRPVGYDPLADARMVARQRQRGD
jgi:hypothetical protein